MLTKHVQKPFNASEVVDAMFAGMLMRGNEQDNSPPDLDAVRTIIEIIDDGLKTAGLSFAEYLERLRLSQDVTPVLPVTQRWRFSARERAKQRVDDAVSQLCMAVQHLNRSC
jgi:hypothetical protein